MTRDLLDRLLGPEGPEVSCEICFEQLDAYVDTELAEGAGAAAARWPGMREHLTGCPACDEDHRSLRDLVRESA
jgi:hypothetical protein